MKKFKTTIINSFFDVLELILVGCILFGIVNLFLGQLLTITGDSMLPTFKDNEQIIAEKISLNFREPQRGNIVIFKHPSIENRLVIKRVVGLPGETLLIKAGKVFIDGNELEENYLYEKNETVGSKAIGENVDYKISKDSYVLLGDNRTDSADSREWGEIKKENIVGKAFLVYYPLQNIRIVNFGK